MEQRAASTMRIWGEPFVVLRIPKLFKLRTDPYERADTTPSTYCDWFINHVPQINLGMALVQPFLDSFVAFPPRQKAASFSLDQAIAKMQQAISGGH
ncbi:hypothetical protein AB4Z46_08190 [Variovorax sp. M-6]|uniref:hypothetical protein n=1 Tax=Variovorax sp. M-6 TaxID=3233041 RepID=UPI003F979E59